MNYPIPSLHAMYDDHHDPISLSIYFLPICCHISVLHISNLISNFLFCLAGEKGAYTSILKSLLAWFCFYGVSVWSLLDLLPLSMDALASKCLLT